MATLEEFLKEIGKGATTGIGLTSGVRGILDTLGIGARGLDTPAERDYLQGVMDTANIGYERTGGVMNTGGVMDGVGARGLNTPAEQAFLENTMGGTPSAFMEKMNWLQNNPNANEYELQLLGIGGEQQSAFQEKMNVLADILRKTGLSENSPQFRDIMYKEMSSAGRGAGDYTFGVDGQTESYGFDSRPTAGAIQQMRIDQGITADVGARGMNTATEQAFLQKVMQLDPPQQNTVMQVLSGMTDAQKQNFKMQVITGQVPLGGYEVQNTFGGYGELTPNYGGSANRQQMLQYNREGNIQNLGFAGY